MKTHLTTLVFLFFVIHFNVFGQTTVGRKTSSSPNQEEVNRITDYFKKNIATLDPIEGHWHFEVIARGWNNYRRFPDQIIGNDAYAIVKDGPRFNVYPTDNYITKVGPNNYAFHYVLEKISGQKQLVVKNFTLSDLYAFSVVLDLPVVADMVGSRGQHIFNSNKIFPTQNDYQKAIVEEAKPTEWSGTGFALNNGYIVTNYHVVDGANQIEVHGVNGNASSNYSAEVVALDKNNDLAIIRLNDYRFNGFGTIPYSIGSQMIDVGEDIWVLGYPLTQVLGNEIKLTNGVISSRSGYQGDVSTYQISAPVQPGNSGGPLFDSKGNIIGVVNAGVPGADNVGYAIKTSYLKNLADSYLLSSALPTYNSISSLSLKEQVKRVKNFVFLLLCSSEPGISKSPATSSLTAPSSTTKSGSSVQSTQVSVSSNKGGRDGRIDSLNQSEITIKVGDKFQLLVSPESVKVNKWETDNYKVASVSADGVVTGLGKGQTNIWVYGPYNTARCLVTVKGYFD